MEGPILEKMIPQEKVLSYGEKIARGEEGVVNIYKARGMFNGEGEFFSDVTVQKTKENPSIEAVSSRN